MINKFNILNNNPKMTFMFMIRDAHHPIINFDHLLEETHKLQLRNKTLTCM